MNLSSIRFPLALLGSLLGTVACGGKGPAAQAGPLEVNVVEVKPQDIALYADFVGTVDGVENADIRARVAGYVQVQHFKGGERLKKGDPLYTIDPVLSEAEVRKAQGDLAIAKAAAAKAKADVDRLSPLVQTNAVSRQELDHATASYDSANAQIIAADGQLRTAQANLEFTKVRSPIDGFVGISNVSVGTLVGQGEPTLLTTVSQIDPVRVRFPISEQLYLKHAPLLNRLATGAQGARRMQLFLADGSEYPELGWIALLDRAVSVSTGSILIEARFPNPTSVLRPGQFARVRAMTELAEGAIAVPQRAVIERQSMHEVFTLGDGNKVSRRAVVAGKRVGSYWIIDKGLATGDRVLLDGIQKVKPDMVVVPHVVPLGELPKPREAAPPVPEQELPATAPSGAAPVTSAKAPRAPAPTPKAPAPAASGAN